MSSNLHILRVSFVCLASVLGGYVCYLAQTPLPWMIGPLVVTAILVFSGSIEVAIPVQTRTVSQAVVASQVGLAFSPAALAALLESAPLLVGMAFVTIILGFFMAFVLSRAAHIRLSTAMIATLPTSPVEAAVIAEQYGYPTAPIILAQTMRVAMVVVLIPTFIYLIDGRPDGGVSRFNGAFEPVGLIAVAALAIAGAAAFVRLRLSNPFFLGPLAFVSAATAFGMELPSVPSVALWGAQVFLGTWLGANFRRTLFAGAGRMVAVLFGSTLLFIAGTALISTGIALMIGIDWETLVLGSSPGGVTEMALTAKYMHSDVALITAFHITRIFMIVPWIPQVVGWIHRWEDS